MPEIRMSSIAAALLLAATACVPEATPEELEQMCAKLIALRGEVSAKTLEERSAEVEEEFARELKRLTDWMERDLESWDEELTAKLAELTDEAQKQKLGEEYAAKKEVTRQQHLPGIEEIAPKKKAALEEAARQVAEAEAARRQKVEECVGKAHKEGVSQKLAVCRAAAADKDHYWNRCR